MAGYSRRFLDVVRAGLTQSRRCLLFVGIAASLCALTPARATAQDTLAWGRNASRQLGDGTTATRITPVRVKDLANVRAISPGGEHSLALKLDGTVSAWGNNASGQLGDGTTTMRITPVHVSRLSDAQSIAAGQYHSLALGVSKASPP